MENALERSRVSFISKVMGYMGAGLLVTFVTAYFTSTSQTMINLIYGSGFTVFLLCIAEIGLVIYLSRRIDSMSLDSARLSFFIYSMLNGLTLSSIFLMYSMTSIISVFLVASLMFIISGLIGISIKKDLSSMGHFFTLSLIGIIVLGIIGIFVPGINTAVCFIGVILFSALTAYDMQKLKEIHYNSYAINPELVSKYSIIGALTLYLDFINIFLYLIRLFGNRRD